MELAERRPLDGPLVLAHGGENLALGPELARHVFVEPLPARVALQPGGRRLTGQRRLVVRELEGECE